MRRTSTLLASALLAGAAALTAPTAANAATPGPGGVGSCTWTGYNTVACSGLDPQQTWSLAGQCSAYDWNTNTYSYYPYFSGWVTGNTTNSGACTWGTPTWRDIVFGPAVPAGPVGQITGYVGKCLDVRGGSTAAGTPTQMWDCLGNVNQSWKVGADGTIRALGNCLDVQGGRTGNATPVQTYPCNGTGAQQWRLRADGSLLNPQSGRCLDVLGFNTANGTVPGIWDCDGAANQVWHLPA
ncbi:ricin-type beta-trefoil lectin domain protein [Kitasatospora sp. NPDC002227]|uniref:ricin-type beta-trefoil lectin domain protein n=1 Tax=Kitasatospora sp. NPDC002227 TaxID=3154773 RepID=UPI0033324069